MASILFQNCSAASRWRPGKARQGNEAELPRSAAEILITRRRYDRLAAVVMPLSLAGALVIWKAFDFPQVLVLPALVVPAWLLLRFDVPREGRIVTRLTATERGRTALFGLLMIVASPLVSVGLALLVSVKIKAAGSRS